MKLVTLLFCLCWAAAADADVIVLGADRDASIFQSNVNNSNGAGPGIFAGTNTNASPRRSMIAFDLSSIPAGATITDVQLKLTVGQASGGSATVQLFDLTRNWGEGTTGSGSPLIMMTGAGFPANDGDATWNAANYSATSPTLWTTPGGDFNPTASATQILTDTTVGTTYTWESSQLVADVQAWLASPANNFGWLLKGADESVAAAGSVFGFYSSEWHLAPTGNAAQEPKLTITYSIPEPATSALAILAGLGMMCRRPKARKAHLPLNPCSRRVAPLP